MASLERVNITERKRNLLIHYKERTGVAPVVLLSQAKIPPPKGLSPQTIYRWINGELKSAPREHYEFVIQLWESLPKGPPRIAITEELRTELRELKDKSGCGPIMLFKNSSQKLPAGLNAQLVNAWLAGRVRTAKKSHWDFVLELWNNPSPEVNRLQITQELLETLRMHKARTGIGASALLRNTRQERPKGLTATLINSWLENRTKSARQNHLEYVLKRWESLPDS